MKKYFKRPWMAQYWCQNETGEILLINYPRPGKEYNYHYNGDGHIFFKAGDRFDQTGAQTMTREEWLTIRNQQLIET